MPTTDLTREDAILDSMVKEFGAKTYEETAFVKSILLSIIKESKRIQENHRNSKIDVSEY